jgi:hypothetical protein
MVVSRVRHNGVVTARSAARADWDGQVIAMSADRARDFLTWIEATNVETETLDQLLLHHRTPATTELTTASWYP